MRLIDSGGLRLFNASAIVSFIFVSRQSSHNLVIGPIMDNSVNYMTFIQNYPLENSGQIVIYLTELSIFKFFNLLFDKNKDCKNR